MALYGIFWQSVGDMERQLLGDLDLDIDPYRVQQHVEPVPVELSSESLTGRTSDYSSLFEQSSERAVECQAWVTWCDYRKTKLNEL